MSARFLVLWFACVAAVAAVSRAELRGSARGRCALDGRAIEPAARVELLAGSELPEAVPSRSPAPAESRAPRTAFCGVECALAFASRRSPSPPSHSSPPAPAPRFEVRDALDLAPLDADGATFVRTPPASIGGRASWRAFRDAAAAIEHARELGGVLSPNPFAPTSNVPTIQEAR